MSWQVPWIMLHLTRSVVPMWQGLLLSAYLKMLLADPNDAQLRQQIGAVYERHSHFMDAELQQRAVEYQGLLKMPDVASRNVTAMPKWEKRKSLLLRRMAEHEVGPAPTSHPPTHPFAGGAVGYVHTCL